MALHELADPVGFFVGGHLGAAVAFGEMELAGHAFDFHPAVAAEDENVDRWWG